MVRRLLALRALGLEPAPDTISRAAPVEPAFAVFVFYATLLVLPTAAWLVALLALGTLAYRRHRPVHLDQGRAVAVVAILATLVVASAVLTFLVTPATVDGVRLVAQLVLFPVAAAACWRMRDVDLITPLWIGSTFGAIAAGLIATFQVLVLGSERADGATSNPIAFGGIALLFGVVTVGLQPLVGDSRRIVVASRTAAALALAASVLSGSRGVWMAIPVAGLVLVAHRRNVVNVRRVAVAAVAVICIAGAASELADGMPVERAANTIDEINTYFERPQRGRNTSTGARIEAWRSALDAFTDSPVLGIGWGNMGARFDQDVLQRVRARRIATFKHAHNQFIDALGNGGLFGFATITAVFVVPGVIFWRRMRDPIGERDRTVGAVGLLVVTSYAVYAQSEVVLEAFVPLSFYAVTVSVLACQLMDRAGPKAWPARYRRI